MVPWAAAIENAQRDLVQACEDCNTQLLEKGSRRFEHELGIWPTRFDGRLYDAAQRLRLRSVITELERILGEARQVDFALDLRAKLEIVHQGINGLSELDQRLQDLVARHHCLQYVDDSLRTVPYPCECSGDIEKIKWVWPDLNETMDKLQECSAAAWAAKFATTRAELNQALDRDFPDDAAPKEISKVSGRFGRLQSVIGTGFTQADLELLNLCEKLKKIRQELDIAIRSMQNE
jgi:hypothetical protein